MSPEATVVFVNRYVKLGLAAMPDVFEALLAGVAPQTLDARPDPERFTLREVVAHLADWEGVWLQRIRKIQAEDNPRLPSYDEGLLAIDHDYAHSDLAEQLAKYRAGRAELVAFLNTLSDADWGRPGQHALLGNVTLADLVNFILGHDGYHLQQVVQFRKG